MSSVLFARNERHHLMGLLLKIRAVVYVVAGIPVLVAADLNLASRLVGLIAISVAATAPFVARRNRKYSGVRLSAGIDVTVSYLIWVVVPVAAAITLLMTIWTVAVVVFLSSRTTALRFTLTVVAMELSKIGVVLLLPDFAAAGGEGSGWLIVVRAAAIAGAYYVMRALDAYFRRLSAAAESGSERYVRLMDAAPTAFLVVAHERIAYANAAAVALLGGPTTELVGRHYTDVVDPGGRDQFEAVVRRAAEHLEPVNLQAVAMLSIAGDRRVVDAAITTIDYGNDLAIQVALQDLSAQKRAESQLRETQMNYRSFFERIPVALYRSRPNGEIVQANRALVEMLGARDEAELVGLDASSFYVDNADRNHLIGMLDEQRIVVGYEAKLKGLDGSTIWARDTSRLIETDYGPVYEGAIVDVTGRRNIEDELWSRAVQQEAAASIGQIALEAEDLKDVLRSVTETVARVLRTDGALVLDRTGGGEFELVGQSTGMELTPNGIAALADRAHMTAAPVVLRSMSEVQFAAPDVAAVGVSSAIAVMIPGSDIDFGTIVALSRSERVFSSDDLNFLHSVANVLAAAADRATARAKLEELLRSKDSFVASVSHELRTPLTVVTGMAHELNERWSELSDEEMGEFTMMLVEQSRDMADLIEDLLVAARANIGNVSVRSEPVELDRQVSGVLQTFPSGVGSRMTAQLEEAVVDADPIRVRQILRNLLTNAVRYGGPNIEVVMSSTAGARVVEVIDDGTGIGADDQERIFEPYERAHSSEGQPGSVGLGLSVSRTLAELMGGSLTYHFNGRSVFRLELARDTAEESKRRPVAGVGSDKVSGSAGSITPGRVGVDVAVFE